MMLEKNNLLEHTTHPLTKAMPLMFSKQCNKDGPSPTVEIKLQLEEEKKEEEGAFYDYTQHTFRNNREITGLERRNYAQDAFSIRQEESPPPSPKTSAPGRTKRFNIIASDRLFYSSTTAASKQQPIENNQLSTIIKMGFGPQQERRSPSVIERSHDIDIEDNDGSDTRRTRAFVTTRPGTGTNSITNAIAIPNSLKSPVIPRKTLSLHDFEILETLGEGSYGVVKLAVRKNDHMRAKVIIKYVFKSLILVDSWTRDRKLGATIPAEIHILNRLKSQPHENIGEMFDYFEDDDHYYIVMHAHGQLDLYDFIEANKFIPEREIKRMFKQVAMGVRHLHVRDIVHRDIKDENIVLDEFGECLKLIDFGSAAYIKPGRQYEACCVGTLEYAAPEILQGRTYAGKPQDIWALGILLFTLIYRENPFYDLSEIMNDGHRIKWPYIVSKGSVDLISKMLERDVEKRIDIHGVLAHPWLNC